MVIHLKIVKCPKCNQEILTKGLFFFRHCGRAWSVEKCLVKELETYRFYSKDKVKNGMGKPKTEDSNNENAPGGEFLEIETGDDENE
jgi:hypothetical protein